MKVKSWVGIIGCFMIVSGCVMSPKAGYQPVADIDPEYVRSEFSHYSPKTFELVSSAVFKYRGQSMAALGYTTVDVPEQRFHLSGMNPFGLTLFSVSGEGDDVVCEFGMEEFVKQGDFKQVIAEVVRNVYFNTVPAASATVEKTKYEIIFRDVFQSGRVEFVFAGRNTRLVEKRYFEKRRKVWSVYYSDYVEQGGKLYPEIILFKHHRYRYAITLSLKEVCA